MTDDEILRRVAVVIGIVAVSAFREPIMRWLRKIGYTGWQ